LKADPAVVRAAVPVVRANTIAIAPPYPLFPAPACAIATPVLPTFPPVAVGSPSRNVDGGDFQPVSLVATSCLCRSTFRRTTDATVNFCSMPSVVAISHLCAIAPLVVFEISTCVAIRIFPPR
jgi:hypothetical protein